MAVMINHGKHGIVEYFWSINGITITRYLRYPSFQPTQLPSKFLAKPPTASRDHYGALHGHVKAGHWASKLCISLSLSLILRVYYTLIYVMYVYNYNVYIYIYVCVWVVYIEFMIDACHHVTCYVLQCFKSLRPHLRARHLPPVVGLQPQSLISTQKRSPGL